MVAPDKRTKKAYKARVAKMRINQLYRRVSRRLRPTSLSAPAVHALFSYDLIVHFSYHKCLTLYYKRIMQRLSAEFGFTWTDYYGNSREFHQAALDDSGKRVLVLIDNSDKSRIMATWHAANFK